MSSDDEKRDSSSEEVDSEDEAPKAKRGGGAAAGKRGRGRPAKNGDGEPAAKKAKSPAAAKNGAAGGKGKGGIMSSCTLSKELAKFMGKTECPRQEVVKKVWATIKEKNLYDPKNKQFAICNDELMPIIGTQRFRTFGMMKFLAPHITTIKK